MMKDVQDNPDGVRIHDHRLRLKQRFEIVRKLGQGACGKVQLGINKKTAQLVAIKIIKKCKIEKEEDLVRIRREVQIMSSVKHPNIVHIYEVFENSEKIILVMEYCPGGELYDYLSERKRLEEDEARRIFRQIATAIYYCHKHKICHRDLKLENVLLDENGNAKIADFGLSNVFEEKRLLSTFCGSPLYASPEIVKGIPYIGPEVDCWSLGVLLYTLVYGAMPFVGSNFKKLVTQITTGDYFKPKKPSPASDLIRDMLTVDPTQRADIVYICNDPWVNKDSDVSCLELAEALANETPVRLDLLLSLAPPPISEKLVITDDTTSLGPDGSPSRSMSVANIDTSAERRILELVAEGGTDAIKPSPTRTIVSSFEQQQQPKRKLETTLSMDSAPTQRKKERNLSFRSYSKPEMDSDDVLASELNDECDEIENEEPPEMLRNMSMDDSKVDMDQNIAKSPSLPASPDSVKSRDESMQQVSPVKETPILSEKKDESRVEPLKPLKKDVRKETKTKDTVLKEKNASTKPSTVKKKTITKSDEKTKSSKEKSPSIKNSENDVNLKSSPEKKTLSPDEIKNKPSSEQLKKSKITDTAEKMNNLSIQTSPNNAETASNTANSKPKRVIIPGVSVGSFKEQFERRASLTSATPQPEPRKLNKSTSLSTNTKSSPEKKTQNLDLDNTSSQNKSPTKEPTISPNRESEGRELTSQTKEENKKPAEEPKKTVITEASRVIKPVLSKSESLNDQSRDVSLSSLSLDDARRSLQQSMDLLNRAKNDSKSSIPEEHEERQKQLKTAREIISNAISEDNNKKVQRICMGSKPPVPYGIGGRSASGSISLSSLGSMPNSPPPMSPPHGRSLSRESPLKTYRTEISHKVDDVRNKYSTNPTSRGGSVERIIPIHFTDDTPKQHNKNASHQMPYQRNNTTPYRLNSVPRGGSVEVESEKSNTISTPSRCEPIKKSPREFIIPIAVEGGGYVTPRQGSLEPSETPTKLTSNIGFSSSFSKPRRLSSLVSGGESDEEDDIHMHRLRSTKRHRVETDKEAVSSGEEDDDEGFELLTAENLFSTLLERVRNLTNRLNGEEGPGFHHQSLFNNFNSPFFNSAHLPRKKHQRHNIVIHTIERMEHPYSETREGPSWRRSTSRDIASEFDSMFKGSSLFPGGSKKSSSKTSSSKTKQHTEKNTTDNNNTSDANGETTLEFKKSDVLDLSDLDLSKIELSEQELATLSDLTPALSRRLQNQLLAQLPPAAARSLRRTLSTNSTPKNEKKPQNYNRSFSVGKSDDTNGTNKTILEPSITNRDCLGQTNGGHKIVIEEPVSDASTNKGEDLISHNHKQNKHCNGELSDSSELKTNYRNRDSLSPGERMIANQMFCSSLRSTPDRSVLSKYFSPERSLSSAGCYDSNDLNVYESYPSMSVCGSLKRRPKVIPPVASETSCRRRISRFLRPDFYDTPREESIYVKDKIDKELETQKVLQEIRRKRNKSSRGHSPCSPSYSLDVPLLYDKCNENTHSNGSTTSLNKNMMRVSDHHISKINTETNSCINSVELKTPIPIVGIDKVITSMENVDEIKNTDDKDVKLCPIVKEFPEVKNLKEKSTNEPKSKKFIVRPKSYPSSTSSPEKLVQSENQTIHIQNGENAKQSDFNIPASKHDKSESNDFDDRNVTVNFNVNLRKSSKGSENDIQVDKLNASINTDKKKISPEKSKNGDTLPVEKKKTLIKKKIVTKKKTIAPKSEATDTINSVPHVEDCNDNKRIDSKNESNPNVESTKSSQKKISVLQSIGQKFEKFRSEGFSKQNVNDKPNSYKSIKSQTQPPNKSDLKSKSNNARNIRETSVPAGNDFENNLPNDSTVKRAATITDLPDAISSKESNGTRNVQRVFGLFRRSVSRDKNIPKDNVVNSDFKKNSNETELVHSNENSDNKSQIISKPKRPTSLLLNGSAKSLSKPIKYKGASSDSVLVNTDTEIPNKQECSKSELSKNKRGLRLDFSRLPKFNQGIFNKKTSIDQSKFQSDDNEAKEISNHDNSEVITTVSGGNNSYSLSENLMSLEDILKRNSELSTTSECLTSPNWSSDCDTSKYMSPPPTDTLSDYGDSIASAHVPLRIHENTSPDPENIEDRIRRKSFYSRFNEKKARRKSHIVGPGAKEYIPALRIHGQKDPEPFYFNKYDLSPSSSRHNGASAASFSKISESDEISDNSSCSGAKFRNTYSSNDSFGSIKEKSRSDNKSGGIPEVPRYRGYDSIPRYSRAISLFDNGVDLDVKSSPVRYGRTLSMLTPGSYATYSPRTRVRNSAILLRDDSTDDAIYNRIRSRRTSAAPLTVNDTLNTRSANIQSSSSSELPR